MLTRGGHRSWQDQSHSVSEGEGRTRGRARCPQRAALGLQVQQLISTVQPCCGMRPMLVFEILRFVGVWCLEFQMRDAGLQPSFCLH
jgi:hypothetical protein